MKQRVSPSSVRDRRGVGRPSLGGDGPSDVVQVRLDEQLRRQLAARAVRENTTPSAVVRDAIKAWLLTIGVAQGVGDEPGIW